MSFKSKVNPISDAEWIEQASADAPTMEQPQKAGIADAAIVLTLVLLVVTVLLNASKTKKGSTYR